MRVRSPPGALSFKYRILQKIIGLLIASWVTKLEHFILASLSGACALGLSFSLVYHAGNFLLDKHKEYVKMHVETKFIESQKRNMK